MKNFVRQSATVEIEIYKNVKYYGNGEEEGQRIQYKGVKYWEVVHGEAAERLEAESDGSCIDNLHEYLVLYFEDGDTATFRNSYVDMFII